MSEQENPESGQSIDRSMLGDLLKYEVGDNDLQSLKKFLDLKLEVRIELGHTKIKLKDLIQMKQGGVIAVDKFAGEPLDILINDRVVAHGEAVVVNDNIAIRLTDIIASVEPYDEQKSQF